MKIWKMVSSESGYLIDMLNDLQKRPGVEIRAVVNNDVWGDYDILYTTEEDEERDDENVD